MLSKSFYMLLVAKRLYSAILILSVNNGFDKSEYAVASKADTSFRKRNPVIRDHITTNVPIKYRWHFISNGITGHYKFSSLTSKVRKTCYK